ncbi:TlpA disulfide reductase family protein [Herminiimonas sp. CN]|uniref:TlpA disulfide reductase family protein n=1 Tax=Herminiimonas sp. CN TaxID=1349818 RepID=UPI00047313C7|nr:TlpA disulfide reductase family protein [Herminiimonas sp. CN]
MKRNAALFVFTGLLFAAIGAYFGVQRLAPDPAQAAAVNRLLAQTLPDAHGQPQALFAWRGQPMIVNFWATWCAPCVQEMPELSALQAEIAPRGIQLLGIGIDSADNIAKFADKYRIGYPLFVAGVSATELTRAFGNQAGGLPYTVLIGRDGHVKKTYLGRLKIDELRADLSLM